ncbi:ribosome biogenesis GTPase YlqF [Peredibacter starrii]|uniref:Ribosome biogenesis GTPase A n=1 Tax=Peredibacter starrii TaxID=28202 RepID=A0AAX4HK10_9BACT|nr:ribosome biogenesis GTPase YlqF [Peredibacter starrii]WPU63591.1 ribosome biogenesis GTPase YlqF [Peredibacter starrii]
MLQMLMNPNKKFNKPGKPAPKPTPKPKAEPVKFKIDAEPNAAFNWFPGHMLKAMREIKAKINAVDLVIEIRDARVPIVSGNPTLWESIGSKARLILLNKTNLADPAAVAKWDAWFKEKGEPYLFVNCLDKNSLKQVLSYARKIIEDKRRACNNEVEQKSKYGFMIIGLPNTGKSTFINSVANRNATKKADKPGQTRHQLWVDVDEHLQLLDTPGVMPPELAVEEHRFWLSAINAIPDEIIGEEDPACYLVRFLLKNKSEAFKERYKLESFDMSLDETLTKIATVRGCLKQKGLPDLDRVFKLILLDFRAGELGKVCFSLPPKN